MDTIKISPKEITPNILEMATVGLGYMAATGGLAYQTSLVLQNQSAQKFLGHHVRKFEKIGTVVTLIQAGTSAYKLYNFYSKKNTAVDLQMEWLNLASCGLNLGSALLLKQPIAYHFLQVGSYLIDTYDILKQFDDIYNQGWNGNNLFWLANTALRIGLKYSLPKLNTTHQIKDQHNKPAQIQTLSVEPVMVRTPLNRNEIRNLFSDSSMLLIRQTKDLWSVQYQIASRDIRTPLPLKAGLTSHLPLNDQVKGWTEVQLNKYGKVVSATYFGQPIPINIRIANRPQFTLMKGCREFKSSHFTVYGETQRVILNINWGLMHNGKPVKQITGIIDKTSGDFIPFDH